MPESVDSNRSKYMKRKIARFIKLGWNTAGYLDITIQREDAKAIFDRICDPENWKKPVHATIEPHELGLAVEAIRFFTGSETYFFWDGKFQIYAPGYYETVGA